MGGSEPCRLKEACVILSGHGYKYFNLNLGCPSPRVQKGGFGAYLMQHPKSVIDCLQSMSEVVDQNHLSVKCRIGIDDMDSDEFLDSFISECKSTGVKQFIVHARIAKLNGLNPKQNRSIPPLNYNRVLKLKQKHTDIHIIVNGGIKYLEQSQSLLNQFDGIMFGRLCYENIYLLHTIYSEVMRTKKMSRKQLLEILNPKPKHYKYIHSLYLGIEGASRWRTLLHNSAHCIVNGID